MLSCQTRLPFKIGPTFAPKKASNLCAQKSWAKMLMKSTPGHTVSPTCTLCLKCKQKFAVFVCCFRPADSKIKTIDPILVRTSAIAIYYSTLKYFEIRKTTIQDGECCRIDWRWKARIERTLQKAI